MSNTLNALRILNILKENSDKSHPIRIVDIAALMVSRYGGKIQPRTVGDILNVLSVEDDRVKFIGGDDENTHRTGVYYDHLFKQSELRLLIDMLLFSKLLTKKQTTELINKLTGLNSRYFKKYTVHSMRAVEAPNSNNEVLKNIRELMKAIDEHKKVRFDFAVYDFKGSLGAKNPSYSDVKERIVVTPIYTLYTEGKYFLVCKFPKSDKLYHYRIDKIKKICVLEENGDDFKTEPLGDYARKHFNSFSGTPEIIKFYADKTIKNKIIDAFGADIDCFGEKDDRLEIRVNVSPAAFKQWAVANCETVEVKSPAELREELASIFKSAAKKYERKFPIT